MTIRVEQRFTGALSPFKIVPDFDPRHNRLRRELQRADASDRELPAAYLRAEVIRKHEIGRQRRGHRNFGDVLPAEVHRQL